jgi:cytochrome c
VDTKVIGPSIKDIVRVYDEKNGNIVQFLKGNSPAIVDTDPGQVAIMKANLDGFVKDLTPEELQALAAYMRSKK